MTQRISMMGCLIDNLTMEETLQRVASFIRAGTPHQHVVVNVDKLVKASREPELRRIINDCALINIAFFWLLAKEAMRRLRQQ